MQLFNILYNVLGWGEGEEEEEEEEERRCMNTNSSFDLQSKR